MSAGELALILVSIAQQLKRLEKKEGEVPPEIPVVPGVPVVVVPEVAEPVFDVKYKETNNTVYQEVLKYEVPSGFRVTLKEIALAPDASAQTKAQFRIVVAGAEVKDLRLLTSYSAQWDLRLSEGAKLLIEMKSTDGTTVACNASFSARRVRVT